MTTKLFNDLCNASAGVGEKNDCSVKAIAAVTGISYEEAIALAAKFGRKARHGMQTPAINEAIISIGFKVTKVDPKTFISRYNRKNIKNVSTFHPERFPEVWKDGKTYLFYVKGHVAAIIDGVNHDWTEGKSKHAKHIYLVEKA